MSCGSRPEVWIAAILVAAATRPLMAQGWHETQVWGAAVASRPAVASAGFGIAWRDPAEGLVYAKYGPAQHKAFYKRLKSIDADPSIEYWS